MNDFTPFAEDDISFQKAIELFNNQEWYIAHDALEAIWHKTDGMERITIQAILQIAVAQVHLSNANYIGATILYGEGLGRLINKKVPDLGLDLKEFINILKKRLLVLQNGGNLLGTPPPVLNRRSTNSKTI